MHGAEVAHDHHCTAENPMPDNRDVVGGHWVHHGARPVTGFTDVTRRCSVLVCPNCGHQFLGPPQT